MTKRKIRADNLAKHFMQIEGTVYGPCLTIVIGIIGMAHSEFELWLDNGDRLLVPCWYEVTLVK